MGILVFGSWYLWSLANTEAIASEGITIVRLIDLTGPPSIKQRSASQFNVAEADAPPPIAVPDPVSDESAQHATIATQREIWDEFGSGESSAAGDSIVVDIDESPDPDQFVAVDELPVPLSIGTPAYPELAREAGFNATVKVKVLVGKDGKVKQAIAIEGPELFREPSVAAAKGALFRPARRGGRPVEVWIVIPFIFELQK